MAFKLSTGLRNNLLGSSSFKTTFTNCKIEYFIGQQPATADDAATGTKLLTFNLAGVGLTFGSPVAGAIDKTAAETWSAVAVASGTAGWFRISTLNDTGGLSTTLARADGSIGVFGADVNISTTAVVSGSTHTISKFNVTIPTA